MADTANSQAHAPLTSEHFDAKLAAFAASLVAGIDAKLTEFEGKIDVKLDAKFTEFEGKIDAKLAEFEGKIDAKLAEFEGKIDAKLAEFEGKIDAKLEPISDDLAGIRASVVRLECKQANNDVRFGNSLKSLDADLFELQYTATGEPWPQDVAQPARFIDLAVSGSEGIPGTPGERRCWNKKKGRAFLQVALPGGYDSESDNEGENGDKTRTMRMRVIECMGGRFERVVATAHRL